MSRRHPAGLPAGLALWLFQHVRTHGLGEVYGAPVDVVLGQGRAREVARPDPELIADERRSIITGPEIAGAPDLVVAIPSPGTEERDRNYQQPLYGRHGVKEYWIVDPDARMLARHLLGAAGCGNRRCAWAGT